MKSSDSQDANFDEGSGNDEVDQAFWDFFAKSGWDYAAHLDDDEWEVDARAKLYKRTFKKLLTVASPEERKVLETALSHLKAGREINWESIARELDKTSGAVKTQVRRAAAKLKRANE